MSKLVSITCPRCGAGIEVSPASATADCHGCGCTLLLKPRTKSAASGNNLDPANSTPGLSDALSKQKEYAGTRPDGALLKGDDALLQGDTLLSRNQYNQALYVFKGAAAEMPTDYRAWWGVTTATLQHLRAYLKSQTELYNLMPVEAVCKKQLHAAARAMQQVERLAPKDMLSILSDRYEIEKAEVDAAWEGARRIFRRTMRKKNKTFRKTAFLALALLILAIGVLIGLYLPMEPAGRLIIGGATALIGIALGAFVIVKL
ncbi:MAG: hypothetical protein ACOX88_06885 [Christensenellales bacterium]|jgi:DNA-directed RNA polymerase subunit RPC12/RpoP